MTEDRDPYLQSLFAQTRETLEDDAFVSAVMTRTNRIRRSLLLTGLSSTVVLLALAWVFSWPLPGIAMALTQVLSTEIFSIGNSLVALFLTPVNNLATVLFLLWRMLRFGWNRATNLSYIN